MMNEIHCGNNLEIMKTMKDEFIDLIYLDPPFYTGRNHESIKDDEKRTFNDKWDTLNKYIDFITMRLKECHRILKSSGTIYLHVDHHAVHYLKVEMDKIFGIKNFRNEIIWHFPSMSRTNKDFPRKHHNILRYVKSNKWIFNANNILVPYADSTISRAKSGGAGFESKKGKSNYLKKKGKIPDTVFTNIPHIKSKTEALGYPTQKPEKLLDRIIKASSNENDIVFDPFCGCGTTIAVAKKLNRKFIGIDISPIACKIAKKRINYKTIYDF